MALERAAREEAYMHTLLYMRRNQSRSRLRLQCMDGKDVLPAGSNTYIHTYMPKAVGDTELQLAKITELILLARIHALFPHPLLSGQFTNYILQFFYFSFFDFCTVTEMMAVSFFNTFNQKSSRRILSTISHRPGDIKQRMNDI